MLKLLIWDAGRGSVGAPAKTPGVPVTQEGACPCCCGVACCHALNRPVHQRHRTSRWRLDFHPTMRGIKQLLCLTAPMRTDPRYGPPQPSEELKITWIAKFHFFFSFLPGLNCWSGIHSSFLYHLNPGFYWNSSLFASKLWMETFVDRLTGSSIRGPEVTSSTQLST